MRRKKGPLEKIEVEDPQAKAKVSLVLQVLSGEKTISAACKDTGIQPVQYYKLEEKMVQAMVLAAKMPPRRGRGKDPMVEASSLAEKTEELRQEHRRMQSLMRISRKLLNLGARKPRKNGPRKPKTGLPGESATSPEAEPRRAAKPDQEATSP